MMNNINDTENYRMRAVEIYGTPIKRWTPPDDALFSPKKIYEVSEKKARELRLKAIKYAFRYHYSNSLFYNKFCKNLEVRPDDIKTENDYPKIPLISDLLFKDHPDGGNEFVEWLSKIFVGKFPKIRGLDHQASFDGIIDAFQRENITLVFSSGTSGNFSFIPRDKITWDRQMYVCSRIFELSPYNFQSSKYKIIWLGPPPKKTHLYIGRLTIMLLDLFDEAKIYFGIERALTTEAVKLLMGASKGIKGRIKAGIVRPFIAFEENKIMEKLIYILEKSEKKEEEIGIGGPPFFVELLMSKMEKKGLKFDIEKGMVVTAGGWKTFGGIEIPGEKFRERVEKIFGIPTSNCRDIYGMVECNALNVSCEGHYKHIPHSILYPMILNEESEQIGFGESGRFAFLDPLANSYPGFIMTGDRVRLLEKCPVCNRPGPVIEDISRMGGVQDRGCGAALARMFSEEIVKTVEKQGQMNYLQKKISN
jgi:long-chain-fatty-acid---luciferin-component ligase